MEKQEEHFVGKIHQNAVIVAKDTKRVLLVRDHRDVDTWELPGGRLNVDDEPVDGLCRELREELGIEVEVGAIYHTQFLWHVASGTRNFLIMYEVFVPHEDMEFTLDPSEIVETQWVDAKTYTDIKMFDDTRESLDVYFDSK